MVFVKGQTQRSKGQNGGPRSGPTHSHLNSEAKAVLWTKGSLSTNGGGTIRFLMQEKSLDTDFILLKST